jgi:hypothetical protein
MAQFWCKTYRVIVTSTFLLATLFEWNRIKPVGSGQALNWRIHNEYWEDVVKHYSTLMSLTHTVTKI